MPITTEQQRGRQYRLALLLSLGLMVPIGYGVRFAPLPVPAWLQDAGGSIAYEIFWVLLAAFCLPRANLSGIAIAVCLATGAIEVLQLWHPAWLEATRATLLGRLILGNTFSWADFPAYGIGSGLGWLWATGLRQRARSQGPG